MEVDNERTKQINSSVLWSELSLKSSVDQIVLYLLASYSIFCS